MVAYLLDWLALLLRWLHFVAGVAWIGASFYFVWLDNHLTPPTDPELQRRGVGGELWAVHGGGFYNPQKYLVAPAVLPSRLHWFKWEAYTTWLSGFALLALLYLARAEVMLVDSAVARLSPALAVAVALLTLGGAWLVYHGLCRSPLGRRDGWLGLSVYLLLVALAWGLSQLFAARAVYLLCGAVIGTLMAGNVFFVIIPGQRVMVAALTRGETPDPEPGRRGKQRSVHNNYFTLPVLFIMISPHFAFTYGHRYGWALLAGIGAAGVLIRHFFNLRHRGIVDWRFPAAGVALLLLVALAGAPSGVLSAGETRSSANLEQVRAILAQRCVACHAARPSFAGFSAPPAGVRLDEPAEIKRNAARLAAQVQSRTMPLGNLTHMTDAERRLVVEWAAAGAPD
ncbi:protein of unknown function [Pseudogulbenkiania sp. NH8B]|uniref:urate hydroxylase PuuD n=1 Tax=Pseudogulbenkiania sp. (strain NH8B) TaxID=748280 RepID=UPI000227917A|nr:urate hydroxylase PuuD [Pseudogulbenkiania sp. NH8B]BAK75115.1 protein of unknown function [Pseudogulbenkiania sp. NH8B]